MPYEGKSVSRVATVSRIEVSISVDKSSAVVGETVTFTVRVLQDGAPAANHAVYVRIWLFQNWFAVASGTTGSDGTARIPWIVPWSLTVGGTEVRLPCSRWGFQAYDATAGVASGGTVEVAVAYPTRLTLATDKDRYLPGETVVVGVKLEYRYKDSWYPLAGATVTISAFGATRSVTTGSDGTAQAGFSAPREPGTYTVTATYAGGGASSPTGPTPVALAARVLAVQQAAGWLALAAPALAGAGILLLARRR